VTRQNVLLYVDSRYLSPYAMTAFVALCEKGVDFALATVDLAARQNEAPQFSAVSLTRRVPTLVHGQFSLAESSAICEYIDETFPGPALYPADRQLRARARQVQAWLRSDLLPIRVERSTEVVFLRPSTAPLSDAAQASMHRLFSAAQELIPAEGEHIFGKWCIADLDLAMMLNRLIHNGDPVPERLETYARRQWQRPSVQRWVRQTREAA